MRHAAAILLLLATPFGASATPPHPPASVAEMPAKDAEPAPGWGQGIVPAVLARPRHTPAPEYPIAAYREGRFGTVRLIVRVDAHGLPRDATIYRTSGHRDLDRVALAVVRTWTFEPSLDAAGQPMLADVVVPITFGDPNAEANAKQAVADAEATKAAATIPPLPIDDAPWEPLPAPKVAAEPLAPIAVEHPATERRAGHRGTATLLLRIDAAGRVQRVRLRRPSGWRVLDAAALAAAPAWMFASARDGKGIAVPSDLVYPVGFQSGSEDAPPPPWAKARKRVEPMSCREFVDEVAAYPTLEAAALGYPEYDALIKWAFAWNGIENRPQDAFPIARNDVALLRQVLKGCRRDSDEMGPFFMFGQALEKLLGH